MLLLSLTPPNALPLRLAPSGAKGTAPVCAEDGLGGGSLALQKVMLSLSELRDSSCWEIAGGEVKGQREILLHFSRRLCSAVDLRVHCMHPHQERLQAAMWAALGDKSQLGQVGAAFQQ